MGLNFFIMKLTASNAYERTPFSALLFLPTNVLQPSFCSGFRQKKNPTF